MAKKLAIIAVMIAFLFGGPCVPEQYQSRTHATQNKADHSQPLMPPVRAVVNPPIAAPCSQAEPCWTKSASPEKPLPRFERPEWVIVYVTIVYALIAWFQLGAIRRQANIMENQAEDARDSSADAMMTAQATLNAIERQVINLRRQVIWLKVSARAASLSAKAAVTGSKAALLNAQAVINAERPWIEVSIEWVNYGHFRITAVNVGRTPAKLISISGEIIPVYSGDQLHEKPVYESSKALRLYPKLFPPERPRIIDEAFTTGLPEILQEEIVSGSKRLFYVGQVVYTHALSGEENTLQFHTRWCYLLGGFDGPPIPGFCPEGYEEYI